jgi:ribonuclease HII
MSCDKKNIIKNQIHKVRIKKVIIPLNRCYNISDKILEIGIDEAGRGPMFGRVYAGAVILPKDDSLFKHDLMKDSKKFTSSKKITEVSEYIKQHSLKWAVAYATESEIDSMNIRNATHLAMHRAIEQIITDDNNYFLLVDGNDFKPYTKFNKTDKFIIDIPNICIKGGDNKYTSIAAASILAKVARDKYIEELCNTNEKLNIRYGLLKNKGYGTKEHLNGIQTYGISEYHRKTFGICNNYN